jgi:tetratricopeptide (TPR) repeat protein
VVVLGCCTSGLARAEASASDRATARALAGEGYAALKNRDYETAEDRFRRADELVHAPTLVLDHARALDGLGRVGEAYRLYQTVLQEDIPANAPWVWRKAVKDAQQEIAALAPRLAWLTITLKGPSDASLTVDGRALPASIIGARSAADPGEHSFSASASGYITKEAKLTLTAGTEATLELELLPEPPPVVVVSAPPEAKPARELEHKITRDHTLAYVSFGVGGVGLATGAVAGILWLNARRDIVASCGGLTCDAFASDAEKSRRAQDKRRYDTLGTISGVGFAVGLAGTAAGFAFLLFQPKAEAAPAKAVSWAPYWGPTSLGVRGTFQ